MAQKDLVLLTADKNAEYLLRGLFSRSHSLGIRSVSTDFFRHGDRDPGCLRDCHKFLLPFIRTHSHALVVFDREGCGREARDRKELEVEVEERLCETGWGNRATAIVIDPELENWVWTTSPHVDAVLGWTNAQPALRAWLTKNGLLTEEQAKPSRPKEAMQSALFSVRKPRSSALYHQLASRVSFSGCTDPAFCKLRSVLQAWFPPL